MFKRGACVIVIALNPSPVYRMTQQLQTRVSVPLLRKSSAKVGDSRFWRELWSHYKAAPSVAICRVPELEFAATLPTNVRFLDHCCGDGKFAELAWPHQRLTAGVDINERSIEDARQRGQYDRLDVCDVSKRMPYADGSFDVVFNNSALEHVPDVDAALAEVARVLAPGGVYAMNVLNHRYFDWWPLSAADRDGYRGWQPFYHAFSIEEWTRRMEAVGLKVETLQGYFDKPAARWLATLDCQFSGKFIANKPTQFTELYVKHPAIMERYVEWRCAKQNWITEPDKGAGYFIVARKV